MFLRDEKKQNTKRNGDATGCLNLQYESMIQHPMLENYLNSIIQGDCLQVLREMPDNSVDVTFADPPFNLKKKYNSTKDRLALQEYLDWCDAWISELVRITQPTG